MPPLELTILRELFSKAEFAETVVPYLKEEYFHSPDAARIYGLYEKFYNKFRVVPSIQAIRIGLDSVTTLNEREAKSAAEALAQVEATAELLDDQRTWLLEQTEEYVQDRAVYCGLQKCIGVMDDPKTPKHAITDIMKEALSVSFDTNVGHDFLEDADARWEFYHKPENRIPFDLETLNNMTKGGVPKKTLNIIIAGTNVGKSLALVHIAAAAARMSHTVLYITCEMREEWIGQRVDANMMDIPMDDVESLPRGAYIEKIQKLKATYGSFGRIIIKEYPTGTASVQNFRALLQELRAKQNFVPDMICVDYINIVKAAGVKMGGSVNSYLYLKHVAEELRGLAVETNTVLWTASQFNRTGFASSDPTLADTGESFAIPQTADFMFGLIQTEELEKLSQIAVQPLKNRYRKKNTFQQLLMGIDTDRMKLYELNASQIAQSLSLPPSTNAQANSKPALPNTTRKRALKPLQTLRKESEGAQEE
jgi:replicative DNA helicase